MTQCPVDVLWIDDDAPSEEHLVGAFRVYPAKTCAQALELLKTGACKPSLVIIDYILPQSTWDAGIIHLLPGIPLVDPIRKLAGPNCMFLSLSHVFDEPRRALAIAAGITEGFVKRESNLMDVLDWVIDNKAALGIVQ